MTVAELIVELKKHKPIMNVLMEGYEDGFAPISVIRESDVYKRENAEWYNGDYEETWGEHTPVSKTRKNRIYQR